VLKRLLASLALVSLLIACALLVYWWRSDHGHIDSYTMGGNAPTKTVFTTGPGAVWIKVVDSKNATGPQEPGMIVEDMRSYPFKNILGYFLLVPALWLAIKIRNLLPRPPGMERKVKGRLPNSGLRQK
jgi:hypothetical protein